MSQKRCLNCRDYRSDENDYSGGPLPEGMLPYCGVCQLTNTRMKDGWACGKWIQKEDVSRGQEGPI
ncbi:hypothetical protein ES703_124409 [subsurface metagenome]